MLELSPLILLVRQKVRYKWVSFNRLERERERERPSQ